MRAGLLLGRTGGGGGGGRKAWQRCSPAKAWMTHCPALPCAALPAVCRLEEAYAAAVAAQGGLKAARPRQLLDMLQAEFPEMTLEVGGVGVLGGWGGGQGGGGWGEGTTILSNWQGLATPGHDRRPSLQSGHHILAMPCLLPPLSPSIALPQIVRWHVQADRRREQQQRRRQQQRQGTLSAPRSASHTATTTANTGGTTGSFASPERLPVSGSASTGPPTVQQRRRQRWEGVQEGGELGAPWPVHMPWQHHLLPAGEAAVALAIKNRRLCAQVCPGMPFISQASGVAPGGTRPVCSVCWQPSLACHLAPAWRQVRRGALPAKPQPGRTACV